MKLKARELTIYDWVLYENEPMKIAEITSCLWVETTLLTLRKFPPFP